MADAAEIKLALRDALSRCRLRDDTRRIGALVELAKLSHKLKDSLAWDAAKGILKVVLDTLDATSTRKASACVAQVRISCHPLMRAANAFAGIAIEVAHISASCIFCRLCRV